MPQNPATLYANKLQRLSLSNAFTLAAGIGDYPSSEALQGAPLGTFLQILD
jgi:hypothetical protein